MSTKSPQENRPELDRSSALRNTPIGLLSQEPSINICTASPDIMRKLDGEADQSTAKITTSEQSHSLETNVSPLGYEVTPKALEFSPGSESELFSPNKYEDDRPKSVSPINLNLTVIIEQTQQSSWSKGVGCQSAIRTNASPSLKFTKNQMLPAFEITSRASAQSKDCTEQRPSSQDLLSDRLEEKEKNHRGSLTSTIQAQALTSSRTNSQISESRPPLGENGETFISDYSYAVAPFQFNSKILNPQTEKPEIQERQSENQARERRDYVEHDELNVDELSDLVENQVLFEGIGQLSQDFTFSNSHRSRKQSEEDFSTRAKRLNSRRTSYSSIGSQTRRNLESRLKIVNLEQRSRANESRSSSPVITNEEFKSKLKMQADKIKKLRRQSTLHSRQDSIDSFQMDAINIKSNSPQFKRQSTFSPQRRTESPFNSSPTSSKTSGSPTMRAKGGQSPVNILNLRNCALRRVESPVPKNPRSKFSNEKQGDCDERYAQYYESSKDGDSNIDNFDMEDFFKDYHHQPSVSCQSQDEITEEFHKEEVTSSDTEEEKEEVQEIEPFDNNECTKELYEEHMVGMYKALVYLKEIEKPKEQEILQRRVPLPRLEDKNLKTLVFDLDQTLIHCVDNIELEKPDKILMVNIPGVGVKRAGINIRPMALQCLEYAHQHFEVIVFTASHRAYADAVLDYLDPHQQYIDYRLYREHCVQTKHKIYMKDLRVLGNRELHKVTIIDNHVYSFGFQLDNGIPILPFYNDQEDIELKLLISYFKKLKKCKDVRNVHRKHFEFSELLLKNIENFVRFYEEDSDDESDDLCDTHAQEIANHIAGHSDRVLKHNDSSGSSQINDRSSEQGEFSQNGDAGSGGGIAAAAFDQNESSEPAYEIRLNRAETPTNTPAAPASVPVLKGFIRRMDTITQFKSPDYLQKNPMERNRPLTPRQNGNKAKANFNKLMEEYPKVKLTLQEILDSEDEMDETKEEESLPKRKKSELESLEKSHSDHTPDLMTLIGKLITPNGKPVLKKPKSGREQRPKRSHRAKEEVMDREQYLRVLKKMEIGSNSANSSQATRTDSTEEMELESSFQVIQDFISKSKGTLFPDSEQ